MYSLKPAVQELERFYQFMNKKFKLNLPDKVVITIQNRGRKNALGWFCTNIWDNHKDKGLNEINICAEALLQNPYETLAHETAHYLELLLRGKLSRNNYHTKTFKEFAEKLLLEVKHYPGLGWAFTKPTKEFNAMLEEFKANKESFEVVRSSLNHKMKAPTKMKKWFCSCGCNVRCAVELNAICTRCNTLFLKEEVV